MREQLFVFDDVLAEPHAYRGRVILQSFGDVQVGPDTFKGIALAPDRELVDAFKARVPAVPRMTFFRRSEAGQAEPNYIHSDHDMGEWTGIYYMNPDPPEGDGTTFWERDGAASGSWTPELAQFGRTAAGWMPWRHVVGRFNRLLVFASSLYHSRGLFDNYGHGDSARLIQVVFA